jgi:isoleucyl-tRNA synthetase
MLLAHRSPRLLNPYNNPGTSQYLSTYFRVNSDVMASDDENFDQSAADDLHSTSTSTIKLEATARKKKAEDAWDEVHRGDEDSDKELFGVEEFAELVKELKSKEKEHEAKARRTRDKLRKAIGRGMDITLSDIRGD